MAKLVFTMEVELPEGYQTEPRDHDEQSWKSADWYIKSIWSVMRQIEGIQGGTEKLTLVTKQADWQWDIESVANRIGATLERE